MCTSPSFLQHKLQFPTTSRGDPTRDNIGWLGVPAFIWLRARCSFSRNSPLFSELSELPSGLPLEYMVASLLSSMNLNQPLLPLDNSSAAASLQRYRQSRPRTMHQSFQLYGRLGRISVASSIVCSSSSCKW